MNRFRGALVALAALVAIGGAYGAITYFYQPPPVVDETPQLFSFEKEDLRSVKLERPDSTVEFALEGDTWVWVGSNWRPADSMVRRVGHQTHDLTARATIADPADPSEYGLGEGAIRVELGLADGKKIAFLAGDPNPTSVSWYLKPLPGNDVFIVKKSAVDYWRMPVEEFRERRFAGVDADKAVAIDAVVDGRATSFRRSGPDAWVQTAPIEQDADLGAVRTMIGRTSALKAAAFVEDDPQDLAKYGLEAPRHTVTIRTEDAEQITLKVGKIVEGSDPQERYILRVEDNAVYAARDGFLSAFTEDLESFRDRRIVHRDGHEARTVVVETPAFEALTITHTPDGWRWPDDSPIPGRTPSMVATTAAGLKAEAFIDEPSEDLATYGLDAPSAMLTMTFGQGEPVVFRIGRIFDVDRGDGLPPTQRRYLSMDGRRQVFEVDVLLSERIDDLINEFNKKRERDAEKGLLDPPDEPAPGEEGGQP